MNCSMCSASFKGRIYNLVHQTLRCPQHSAVCHGNRRLRYSGSLRIDVTRAIRAGLLAGFTDRDHAFVDLVKSLLTKTETSNVAEECIITL